LVCRCHAHVVETFDATQFAHFVEIKLQAGFHGFMDHPHKRDVAGGLGFWNHIPPSTNVGMAARKPHLVDVLLRFILRLAYGVFMILIVRVGAN
jgi:hypothetical protein